MGEATHQDCPIRDRQTGQISKDAMRFFHIELRNNHLQKPATNCYVYLTGLKNITNRITLQIPTIELKWTGFMMPNAVIAPQTVRKFDAGFINKQSSNTFYFSSFSDSPNYSIQLPIGNDYEAEYSILSDNGFYSKKVYRIELRNQIDEVKIYST